MSTEDTERQVRELFAADAADAPVAHALAADAVRRARDTRRVRTVVAAAVLAAAGVLGVVVLVGGPGEGQGSPAAASSEPVPAGPSASEGPVFSSALEDCMAPYSPAGLVGSDLAVDGTVVAIGPEPSVEPEEPQPRVAVTLEVHQWFIGGPGETVTVQMYPPTAFLPPGSPPRYGVGSRLLVPALRSGDGAELIASTSCEKARYYDPATAAEWAAALAEGSTGPTGVVVSVDCEEAYSPQALAGRDFAFDGTVVAIGPAIAEQPGTPFPQVEVTFAVTEWFRGGSAKAVTVQMDPPEGGYRTTEPVAAYGIGTRLLVSGEARRGGAPLDDPIAWSCGFTRYWDPATAAEWAAATR